MTFNLTSLAHSSVVYSKQLFPPKPVIPTTLQGKQAPGFSFSFAAAAYKIGTMPPALKRPLEESTKTGTVKKLLQTTLSFGRRATPSASSASSPVPPPDRYSTSLSSASSSDRHAPPALTLAPTSSRHFSNSSPSGTSQRRSPANPAGLFKNRQWVRQDSGGSSTLSALSLSGKDKDQISKGLDEQEDKSKKQKPHPHRSNVELAAVAKETM